MQGMQFPANFLPAAEAEPRNLLLRHVKVSRAVVAAAAGPTRGKDKPRERVFCIKDI